MSGDGRPITPEELRAAFAGLVRKGVLRASVDAAGEIQYELTPRGRAAKAQIDADRARGPIVTRRPKTSPSRLPWSRRPS